MDEDIVLVAPGCDTFAKRQFPGRKLIAIVNETELDAFLASSRASSLTFCGAWAQLTVRVSRTLAEWAIQTPDRGCGLCLVTDVGSEMPQARTFESNRVYELTDGFPAIEYDAAGKQIIDSDELIGRLLDPKLLAPTGAVLTGHGSEYCIRVGSNWLSTFETTFLTDPIVLPSFPLGSVIFLNCCSSLRLGDSCVPRQYSLATLLHGFGSAVIGSFRNLHTSPHYASVFAQALLAGDTLGRIVNRLNAEAHRIEPGVAFQLLGDPRQRYGLAVPHPILLSSIKIAQLPPPASLERAIEDNVCLERLSAALMRWLPDKSPLSEIHASLEILTHFAGTVDHAWHMIALDEEEVVQVVQYLENQGNLLQHAMLTALARSIQRTGWIQTRYAAHCRRSRAASYTCVRCGGICHRTHYAPFANYLPAIDREECDHCGTTQEWIGDGADLSTLSVKQNDISVTVSMPPLPEKSQGLLLFHRMPSFAPLAWPKKGGTVQIPYAALSFLGRLTLVAAMLGPHCLTLQYHTFFVCADAPNAPKRQTARKPS